MKVKPSRDITKVPKGYTYDSTSEIGEKDGAFIHPYDNPYIAQVNDRSIRNEQARLRDEALLENLLNALGVKTNNSYSNMYLLVQTLLNAKIVLDTDTYAYEIDSASGYIKKAIKLDGLLKDIPKDIENQCYKIVDGELILDEDKYNSIVGAL